MQSGTAVLKSKPGTPAHSPTLRRWGGRGQGNQLMRRGAARGVEQLLTRLGHRRLQLLGEVGDHDDLERGGLLFVVSGRDEPLTGRGDDYSHSVARRRETLELLEPVHDDMKLVSLVFTSPLE